jgi:hypothetical protein
MDYRRIEIRVIPEQGAAVASLAARKGSRWRHGFGRLCSVPSERRSATLRTKKVALRRWPVFAAVILLVGHAHAAEIWLSGLDPVTRARKDPGTPSDFMALFAPNAQWADAARKVRILKISSAFALWGSDRDLQETFAGLKEQGIALAIETGLLSGDGHCGKGMEGYSNHTTAVTITRRIQRLGGDLAYVALGGELWFGHFDNNRNACHSPIQDIAREIADHVAEMHGVFPNARIGAIEPITDAMPATALSEYLDAYRAATGAPFAFLHADVQWARAWQRPLEDAANLAHRGQIPFGVIINSDRPRESGDKVWTTRARDRLRAVRAIISPEQLIIQSWVNAPSRWLPETDDSTLTSIVKDAAQ